MSEKIQIAVLGGTFDPVTAGHIQIMFLLCKMDRFSKVLIVPSGRRSDKKKVATPQQILTMLKFAISSLPEEFREKVVINERDLFRENTPTAELMRILYNEEYPREQYELYFVVGGDLVEPLERFHGKSQITGNWYRGKVLWDENKFVIVPRAGYADPHSFLLDEEKCVILPEVPIDTSSTMVRENRKQGKEWMHLVQDQALIEFISYNELYL